MVETNRASNSLLEEEIDHLLLLFFIVYCRIKKRLKQKLNPLAIQCADRLVNVLDKNEKEINITE